MQWTQAYTPIGGNLLLSALAALVPIIFFFWALAIKRMKGYTAGLATLGIALIIAVLVYRMPAEKALMSATQGAVYGLLPIGWIIVTSVFLYKITVKTGQFDIIRDSVLSITDDRRLQALLIAFSFGAFLEGAKRLRSAGRHFCRGRWSVSALILFIFAGICLIANTAPVAFGAIGIPITAVEGPTGIPAMEISQMVGRRYAVFIRIYSSLFNHHHERVQESLGDLAGDSRIRCFLCCCSISQFQFFRA
nr:L-lactate permease [Bacillus subtilis]